MPSNYVRKTNKGGTYTKETLKQAVEEVRSGVYNAFKASKVYNIPMTTIIDHVKGRRGIKSTSFGRSTVLSLEDEQKLVTGLSYMEKYGYGLSRKEVLELVGTYIREKGLKTPFKDGVPSKDWFIAFKKRHNLSLKKPQSVEYARKKACDPFIIASYFDILKTTIAELNLMDKPHLIWNLDETSFCRDPSKTKVLGRKGITATRTTSSSGKENITVLVACNATGTKAPPLIIFKGKNIWDQFMAPENTGFPGTTYAATSNGWMETSVFENYFQNSFLKTIGSERPVLLIYDGHATHVGLTLIEMARSENIVILKLPPHSSHLLQPLDLCVMKSLKVRWDAKLTTWQRHHIGVKLPKKEFSKMIGELWTETNEDVIRNGFKKGGIVPFNDKVIPQENYEPTALQRWKQHNNSVQSNDKTNLPGCSSTPEVVTETLVTDSNHFQNIQAASSSTTTEIDVSFEKLLLATMKSHSSCEKIKKKRVCPGAEVITTDDAVQRLKDNEMKKVKPQTVKKKKAKNMSKIDSSEDEENADSFSLHSSSNESSLSAFLRKEVNEQQEEEQAFKPVTEKQIGDWAIVKFSTKKTVKYFVGNILSFNDDGEAVFRFVKKASERAGITTFHYPSKEDITDVINDDIISILPKPINGRRGEVIFSVGFSRYNIQ